MAPQRHGPRLVRTSYGHFTWRPPCAPRASLDKYLSDRNIFRTKVVVKNETLISLYPVQLLLKSSLFRVNKRNVYAVSSHNRWIYFNQILKSIFLYMFFEPSVKLTLMSWKYGGNKKAECDKIVDPHTFLHLFFPPSCPDKLWGPPGLLSIGTRGIFPESKAVVTWRLPLHPIPKLRKLHLSHVTRSHGIALKHTNNCAFAVILLCDTACKRVIKTKCGSRAFYCHWDGTLVQSHVLLYQLSNCKQNVWNANCRSTL
jgi:hypothetical protein